jgi:hypothetical protein
VISYLCYWVGERIALKLILGNCCGHMLYHPVYCPVADSYEHGYIKGEIFLTGVIRTQLHGYFYIIQ